MNVYPADLGLAPRDSHRVGWPALAHTDNMGTNDLANRNGSGLGREWGQWDVRHFIWSSERREECCVQMTG